MRHLVLPRLRRRGADARGRPCKRFLLLVTTWQGTTRVRWRKCTECTGGAQWLDPRTDTWGKIPYSIRRERRDEVGSPQANIRNCPVCHGTGSRWVAKDGEEPPPWPLE